MRTTATRSERHLEPEAPGDQGRRAWVTPRVAPPIREGEVHVWRASLDVGDGEYQAASRLISEDERTRFDQILDPLLRRQMVAARAILRQILSRYVHTDPASVRFDYAVGGKPRLRGSSALRFNLAHSKGVALFAFSVSGEVGVDVEAIGKSEGAAALAGRFLPAAAKPGATADEEDEAKDFYRAWTEEEARLKAEGLGIASVGKPRSRVSEIQRLKGRSRNLQTPRGHALHSLDAGTGFVAALAAPQSVERIVALQFPTSWLRQRSSMRTKKMD